MVIIDIIYSVGVDKMKKNKTGKILALTGATIALVVSLIKDKRKEEKDK